MSLHWPETLTNIGFGTLYGSELRVLLQPNAIELRLLKRDFMHGFKARVVKQQLIQTDAPTTETLLAKLAEALKNRAWQQGAPVVVLSNAFVHYAVLPWNAEITNKIERKAYLQHTFAAQFGDASRHWHLSTHAAGFGKASIASGVDKTLLDQLHAVFGALDMPLKAVNPVLMQATNQALAYLKKNGLLANFWLACIENGRLLLALLVDGDWKWVRNMAAETDLSTQIRTHMQRESVLDSTYAGLPILLHGTADITLPNLIRLTKSVPQQAFEHSVQAKWAV